MYQQIHNVLRTEEMCIQVLINLQLKVNFQTFRFPFAWFAKFNALFFLLAYSNRENKTTRTYCFAMISSPYCALSRVCWHLLFESQNITFRNYSHDVNSKFHGNRHYRCEALSFVLSDITTWNNLCKNQRNCWKKNFQFPKKLGKRSVTNNIAFHRVRPTNIWVPRLRCTDWKTYLI